MKDLSIAFREKEYAGKRQPTELYHIWTGDVHYRYTSGDTPIRYGNYSYTPATIQRGQISHGTDLDISTLDIQFSYVTEPMIQYVAQNPLEIAWVEVFKLFRDQDPIEATTIFVGQIRQVVLKGIVATARCVGFEQFLKQVIPQYVYQTDCNHSLYDADCGIDKDSPIKAIVALAPSAGLYKEPDTTPLSSAMSDDSDLIDGNRYIVARPVYWGSSNAYGFDLGEAKEVTRIDCFGRIATGHTPIGWYGAAYDSLSVYKSEDNASWTFVETFDAPPLIVKALEAWGFKLELTTSQSARFWKVVNAEVGYLGFTPGGWTPQIGEIEVYGVRTVTVPELDTTADGVSANGLNITSADFALKEDGYYSYGYLTFGEYKRYITNHAGDTVTISYKIIPLIAGESITVYAGCDLAIETCRDKFSNVINFGGFPEIPEDNPALWSPS